MITLRPEQRTTVDKAKQILAEKNIVYLAAEIRTGKTIMALSIAHEGTKQKFNKVCVITKKKAISSIEKDYKDSGYHFDLITVTNFEQVPKLNPEYDLYVVDEAHSIGAFPKPSNRTKAIKELVKDKPVILMSGSPTPETPSQIYHQFWISPYSPFFKFSGFYKWAHEFVNIKKKFINGFAINDYTTAKEAEINQLIEPYMVKLSQEEAGFTSFVEEEIIIIPIDDRMYKLMNVLKRDKVYTMKSGDVILADTPVKMQSLFHQLSSGTLKTTEIKDGKEIAKYHILDESKAWYIKTRFAGHKIAIFYRFIGEGNLLRKVFPNYTDDPQEFNSRSDLFFICQIVSGREGTNLSTADALIMYNIDFSATSYWQGRGRMQTKDRVIASKMYWLFSEKGLERYVYKAVVKKQNYTKQYFQKDLKLIGL
jgi:hypothetical protein